jgi:hypothetical protein
MDDLAKATENFFVAMAWIYHCLIRQEFCGIRLRPIFLQKLHKLGHCYNCFIRAWYT